MHTSKPNRNWALHGALPHIETLANGYHHPYVMTQSLDSHHILAFVQPQLRKAESCPIHLGHPDVAANARTYNNTELYELPNTSNPNIANTF